MTLHVDSEISSLEKLIIHSPDSGLGKVVPSKAQDWLFEDIIHLETMRRKEYDVYVNILLYFLDEDKIKGKINDLRNEKSREFYIPGKPAYFNSTNVVEFETLLLHVLKDDLVKTTLVAAVCALEECSYQEMQEFLSFDNFNLCKTLITGTTHTGAMYFPPIPNLIFTRDVGIMVNDHLLLNKPARQARSRESLLAKYVFFNHPLFIELRDKIIEVEEDEHHFLLPENELLTRINTLEGGDVMMVAPNHLLIGISERTTVEAGKQVIQKLFEKKVLEKVTLVKIPAKRDYMHIDTVFTQIKRNVWVILESIARTAEKAQKDSIWEELGQVEITEQLVIHQFNIDKSTKQFANLEDLLISISKDDLKCKEEVQFVYSGNREFPYGAREQWTDSCNLLVVKEGVAIGYDRNDRTSIAFQNIGFRTISANDLLDAFEKEELDPKTLENTIILLPSAELSRARGGSHCMSMPILRKHFKA